MQNKNSLAKGISLDIISRVAFIVSGYVLNIGLARMLGPKEYGDVLIVLNFLMIYNVFMTNGLRQGISAFAVDVTVDLRDLWKKALIVQIATSAILVAVSLFSASALANFFNDKSLLYPLLLLNVVIPVNGLFFCQVGVLSGLRKYKQQSLLQTLYAVSRVIIIFLVIFLVYSPVEAVIIGNFLGYLIGYVYGGRQWDFANRGEKTISYGELIRKSAHFILLFVFITLYLNIDFFILKNLSDDKILVGQYGAIMNVGKMVYFLIYSFSFTLYPVAIKLYNENKLPDVASKMKECNEVILSISLCVMVATLCVPGSIIQFLFGKAYLGSSENMLPLYCLSIILLSIIVFYAHVLMVMKKHLPLITSIVCSMTLFVASSYYFFDQFGAYAILGSFALALLINFTFLTFLQSGVVKHHFPKKVCFAFCLIASVPVALEACVPSLMKSLFFTIPLGSLLMCGILVCPTMRMLLFKTAAKFGMKGKLPPENAK